MATTANRRRLLMVGVSAVGLFGAVGVAAAQSGGHDHGAEFLNSLRSVTHIFGIVASSMLVLYGMKARRRFAGGVFGEAATFSIIGGVLFGLGFFQMELLHGFGINVFGFIPDMQLMMGLRMILFTGTVFGFGWAFYQMGNALKGT